MHISARDGRHCEMAEFWPNIVLYDAFEPLYRGWAISFFEVLGDIAVKQLVNPRRSPECLPFPRRIAAVHRHGLQDALRHASCGVGSELAVFADREPSRTAVLVPIARKIKP